MAELFDHLPARLDPPNASVGGRVSPNGKRIGRPPGARNKSSTDLARYIAATFGGMTPGQQSAQLALVTPAELKNARRDAGELVKLGLLGQSVLEVRMSPMELAHVVKAARLARGLGCEARDAYLLGQKERQDLMRYVHQAQPIAKPTDGAPLPTVFLADRGDFDQAASSPQLGAPDAEIADDFDAPLEQVSRPKSHDAT